MMWYGSRKTKKVYYRPYKRYIEVLEKEYNIIKSTGDYTDQEIVEILTQKSGTVYDFDEYLFILADERGYAPEEVEEEKKELLDGRNGDGIEPINYNDKLYILEFCL